MIDYPSAPDPSHDPTDPAPTVQPAPTQTPAPAPAPAAAPGRPPAQRRDSSRATTVLLAVAGLVAVGGVAFAVGRMTAPVAAANANRFGAAGFRGGLAADASFAPGQARGLFGLGGAAGAGTDVAVSGTVQSVTSSALTLKTANGDTVTVDLAPSTTYHTATSTNAGSVTSGSHVVVQLQFNRAALGAGAGAAAGASAAPGVPGPLASGATRTLTASDVTLTTP
jgi:hypothetical protein